MLLRRYGWLPNSPDLNPVDYAIWEALQERVYHGRKFENVEQLKQAILLEWRALSQRFIDGSGDVACRVSYRRMVDILNT